MFSIATRSTWSTSYGSGSSAWATWAAVSRPRSGAATRRNAIPDRAAADAASLPPTWAVASQTTNRPGRTNACMAIWLQATPVGR